jgi:hypothetical protein
MTIAVETTPKTSIISYRNKSIEALEKELEALENDQSPEPEEEEIVEEVVEDTPPVKEKEEGLSAEEKTFKKRYGDLRRFQQEKEREWKAKFAELEEKLAQAPSGQMPKTKEQIEAWVKKYPDVAAIVRSLAGHEADQKNKELEKRLKEVEEMSVQVAQEKAHAEILKSHPDFDQIIDTDEFHDWAKTQPKIIQTALYDDIDVRATSRAIDLYKADKGIKRSSPDKNAALAVSTRTRANTPQADESVKWWSESRVSKLSDKEYTDREAEIMEAMRSGKFKYDLSRRA